MTQEVTVAPSSRRRSSPSYWRKPARLVAAVTAGLPAEAAAEFQKSLEHPGVVLEDPMGALARLQLARAWTIAGDVGRAKSAYEELLRLWKDADAKIRLVKEARAEYARVP